MVKKKRSFISKLKRNNTLMAVLDMLFIPLMLSFALFVTYLIMR